MNLGKTNLFFGYLHIISALVLAILFYLHRNQISIKTDIYRYKITGITADMSDLQLEAEKEVDIPTQTIQILLVVMFCVAGFFHLFYYTNGLYSKAYMTEIKKGSNRYRWLEYAITYGIIYFILLLFASVHDLNAIILGVTLSVVMMGMGLLIERSRSLTDKTIGLVFMYAMIAVLFAVLYNTLIVGDEDTQDIKHLTGEYPEWAKNTLIGMGIFSLFLAMLMSLYVGGVGKQGFDYVSYEKFYTYLSFITKAYIGYYTTYGILK